MAKRLDFLLDFSLDFSTTHICATHVSEKYLPSQIFARLTRRYCACFHSTCSTRWPNGSIFTQQQFFCSIFMTKIKLHSTSLDSIRLTQQGGQTDRFFLDFLLSKKSSEKSSRLARALNYCVLQFTVMQRVVFNSRIVCLVRILTRCCVVSIKLLAMLPTNHEMWYNFLLL